MAKASSKQREVTILVRYHIKKGANAGNVILLVENDKGARYYVTLRRAGQHACTCPHVPSRKSPTCYHIERCRTIENERSAQAKRDQDEREISAMTAHIEHEAKKCATTVQVARVSAQPVMRTPSQSKAPVVSPVAISERMTAASLNGSRAFSLMR
jgi:hypothetical protein